MKGYLQNLQGFIQKRLHFSNKVCSFLAMRPKSVLQTSINRKKIFFKNEINEQILSTCTFGLAVLAHINFRSNAKIPVTLIQVRICACSGSHNERSFQILSKMIIVSFLQQSKCDSNIGIKTSIQINFSTAIVNVFQINLALNLVKVGKFQKQIMMSLILPKNEQNTLRIVSCFPDLLTFRLDQGMR